MIEKLALLEERNMRVEASYPVNGPAFREYFDCSDLTVTIAMIGDSVEGFAIAGRGYLYELHVRRKRQGLGRELFRAACCMFRHIALEVHRTNEDAQRFYKAMGLKASAHTCRSSEMLDMVSRE
jgi:ribosomal protein S18 acetylase RimI-like enzyme